MTSHSIQKLCILEAAIAWVIIFMGLSTMRLKYSSKVQCESTHQVGLTTFN